MFNFHPIMDTTSYQPQNPNPNCDSPYSQIANYLMSDVDDGFGKNIFLKNKEISENITHCSYGSSNSLPFASNIKSGREMMNYKTQEELRFAFRTKTDLEFMDDGYKWRKYGKKMVKNNPFPRNYFKCSSGGCYVKKRVERDSEDPSYVITTYQGIHNHHSPTCLPCTSSQPSSLLSISSSII